MWIRALRCWCSCWWRAQEPFLGTTTTVAAVVGNITEPGRDRTARTFLRNNSSKWITYVKGNYICRWSLACNFGNYRGPWERSLLCVSLSLWMFVNKSSFAAAGHSFRCLALALAQFTVHSVVMCWCWWWWWIGTCHWILIRERESVVGGEGFLKYETIEYSVRVVDQDATTHTST